MKQFINVGELTINAYDVLYINKDTKKVFLKDGGIIDFTGEFDCKEIEESDPLNSLVGVVENLKFKEEVKEKNNILNIYKKETNDLIASIKCNRDMNVVFSNGVDWNMFEEGDDQTLKLRKQHF